MSTILPDLSRFALTVPSISPADADLVVLSFRSVISPRWRGAQDPQSPYYWANRHGQHGLSEHYCFDIEIQTSVFIEPTRLLTQTAALQCDRMTWHGYLSTVTCLPAAPSGHGYRLVLSSPLYPLTQATSPKVFIDQTVPEIVEACLMAHGWTKGQQADYHFDLQGDYPKLKCWVQYTENDWDHFQRLLRVHGLFFYFVQTLERPTLIVTDHLTNPIPLDVSFSQANESLLHIECFGQVLSDTTIFSDYDPASPSQPWIASQQSRKTGDARSSYGTLHTHGVGVDSAELGLLLARVRQQSIDWQAAITVASTTLSGLMPGERLSVSNHPIPAFNRVYTIVDIEHMGNQSRAYLGQRQVSADHEPLSYKNNLLLMPDTLPFQKYDGYPPLIQAPLKGKLESVDANTTEAAIDDTGHYRFRYPFDNSDKNKTGMASPKTRFTQLMGTAGNGLAGMHFPSRHGTSVEVAFLHGNINNPVIIGAFSTPPLVNQHNRYEGIVRTAEGHEWRFSDQPNRESILLATPEQKEVLSLQANPTDIGITVKTNQGGMRLKAAQGIRWETAQTLFVQASDYAFSTQENYHLEAGQRIDLETGGHFFLKAALIQLTGHTLSVNSDQNTVMQAQSLDCATPAKKAETLHLSSDRCLHIEAPSIELRASRMITLEHAGAKIVFDNGNISITSPTEIEFIGDSVQFIGTQQRG